MTTDNSPEKASESSQTPSDEQTGSQPDDAILRNLASLMGQEAEKRGSFKSKKAPFSKTPPPQSALREDAQQDKPIGASLAAEQRRAQRLQAPQHSNTPSFNDDEEMHVIFDEDTHSERSIRSESVDDSLKSDSSLSSLSKSSDTTPETERKVAPSRFTTLELLSVGLLLIALVIAAVFFTVPIRKVVAEYREAAAPVLSTPPQSISGKLLMLEGIQSYWRNRKEDDRAQETSNILPVITIKSASGNGTLQIIFHDDLGRISGDTHIFRIDDSISIRALGTAGMRSEIQFTDHRLEANPDSREYWTASLKESADGENWTPLGTYRLTSERR